MVKRIPVQTVIVQRDGQPFSPPLNRPFEFDKAEADQIVELNPYAFARGEDGKYVSSEDDAENLAPASATSTGTPTTRTRAAAAAAADKLDE